MSGESTKLSMDLPFLEKMVTELVMVDLACMKNKTNVEPEQYYLIYIYIPLTKDNSLQTSDYFGSMSVLKGVNSFFFHTASTKYAG